MNNKLVISISKWDDIINWSEISKRISGVIIRVGYTSVNIIKDSKFDEFVKGARNYNIPLSVYYQSLATTEFEAVKEAHFVINAIKGIDISFPIYIHTAGHSSKNNRTIAIDNDTRTLCIKSFCDEIISAGYRAGIMATESWFSNMLDLQKLNGYSIWVIRHSSVAPKTIRNYDCWGYSNSGHIDGVIGNIELNRWYGDIEMPKPVTFAKNKSVSDISVGDYITLSNVPIYVNPTISKSSGIKSGTFYIWSDIITNGRVRITNTKSNVGKPGLINGWINVSDIR